MRPRRGGFQTCPSFCGFEEGGFGTRLYKNLSKHHSPFIANNNSKIFKRHFIVADFPELAFPITGTNGYEIRACLRIIITLQSY
jgi:hypothetical protein